MNKDDIVMVEDNVFPPDIDDLITDDKTWMCSTNVPFGTNGNVLVINGTVGVTWSNIDDINETRIKELIKEHRVRGNIKYGKHTPRRCYE